MNSAHNCPLLSLQSRRRGSGLRIRCSNGSLKSQFSSQLYLTLLDLLKLRLSQSVSNWLKRDLGHCRWDQ